MMPSNPKSTHDLATIQQLVAAMQYRLVEEISEYTVLGFDETDVRAAVALLTPAHAYKTMPSNTRPGCMQDVYKIVYEQRPMYIKFDLVKHPATGVPRLAIILSFKRDTSV